MTIRHLKIFLAVAEYKTMSAAAEKLYISQPTVSQAIRELEEHYHGLLFERLGKKLYLTEMGKILLTRSRDLVQEFQRLDDSMAGLLYTSDFCAFLDSEGTAVKRNIIIFHSAPSHICIELIISGSPFVFVFQSFLRRGCTLSILRDDPFCPLLHVSMVQCFETCLLYTSPV